jgi:hypothetical protein
MLEPISPSSRVDKVSAVADQRRTAFRDHRARPRSTEVELKFAAPATEVKKLERALLAMPTVRSEARSALVSTYYDTPTLALHRAGLTLRVRKQGQKFVQTVKTRDMPLEEYRRCEWPCERLLRAHYSGPI